MNRCRRPHFDWKPSDQEPTAGSNKRVEEQRDGDAEPGVRTRQPQDLVVVDEQQRAETEVGHRLTGLAGRVPQLDGPAHPPVGSVHVLEARTTLRGAAE